MDFIATVLLLVLSIFAAYFYLSRPNSRKQLPPGPYPLPIIGNIILQLGSKPHRSFTKLAKIYGPIMYLKFGTKSTIIVSSSEMAKEILQTHDQSFAGRINTIASEILGRDKSAITALPIGNKWRLLRKICREQIFSNTKLDASWQFRLDQLGKLHEYVQKCCMENQVVNIGEVAFVTCLNMLWNTLFSIDLSGYKDTNLSRELKEALHGYMKLLGTPNIADNFPILGWFDPQGIKREAAFHVRKMIAIFDGVIEERVQYLSKEGSLRKNDVLQDMLDIIGENDSELSLSEIKDLFLDFFTGIDTASSSVEWAMTELLRNPNIMSKAKNELRAIIGDKKELEESDISKLPYLQAVIKESFRLHPTGSLLPRNKNEHEIQIREFTIPKNSTIFINMWAICKDSSEWSNPESFSPERFLDNEVDIKGRHFELLPFGSGRRMCPGLPMAYRIVHLMVATLIHDFDWKLELGMNPEDIDTNESFGLTMEKDVPLKVIPIGI